MSANLTAVRAATILGRGARIRKQTGWSSGRAMPRAAQLVPAMYVPDTLAWKLPFFNKGAAVYVSPHNLEARAVVDAIRVVCGAPSLEMVSALGTTAKCNHWLIYLHKEVFHGSAGQHFADEIVAASRKRRLTIVSVFSPNDDVFAQILNASPRSVREEARLYDVLALEWHKPGEIHHPVSVRLVAKALGAELQNSAQVRERSRIAMLRQRLREGLIWPKTGFFKSMRLISPVRSHAQTAGESERPSGLLINKDNNDGQTSIEMRSVEMKDETSLVHDTAV